MINVADPTRQTVAGATDICASLCYKCASVQDAAGTALGAQFLRKIEFRDSNSSDYSQYSTVTVSVASVRSHAPKLPHLSKSFSTQKQSDKNPLPFVSQHMPLKASQCTPVHLINIFPQFCNDSWQMLTIPCQSIVIGHGEAASDDSCCRERALMEHSTRSAIATHSRPCPNSSDSAKCERVFAPFFLSPPSVKQPTHFA